jgi:DNA modification methylase
MIEFSSKASKDCFCKVIQGDARKINLEPNSIDLAVTSPPYINAVDYVRAHKLEMYWLGLLSASTLELQKQFIGNERVSATDYKELHESGIDKLDSALIRIFSVDKRRAFVVFKFFDDMRRNLREIHRVLRQGGKYVVVIGDGKIRGFDIPTHEILTTIAKKEGLHEENTFSYLIRSRHMKIPRQGIGGLIAADWVVTLGK